MLTGPALGKAVDEAIRLKGVSKAEVARHFGIKGPSVYDWINHGRVGKQHLTELFAYFSDVVGPEHWGFAPVALGPPSDDPDVVASQPAGLDVAKLTDLLETVEAAVAKSGRQVPAKTKAKLIAAMYADEQVGRTTAKAVEAALASILASMERS